MWRVPLAMVVTVPMAVLPAAVGGQTAATAAEEELVGPAGRVGGLYTAAGAEITLANCTVSGNSDGSGGNGGSAGAGGHYGTGGDYGSAGSQGNGGSGGSGGGVFNSGSLGLTNCTIAYNSAAIGGTGRTAGAPGGGGGITNQASASLVNTIVALNTGLTSSPDDVKGNFTSMGHNLVGNTTGSTGFVDSDLLNVDPFLSPLANNGGVTLTHALFHGSPAIDAADDAQCEATDQCDHPRHMDGNGDGTPQSDIGAFELVCPVLVASPVTVLSLNSAQLNGLVKPSVLDSAAWFEWGTTLSYGSTTAVINVGHTSASTPLSATLTGLSPGVTYHFRVAGTNVFGVGYSDDRSFVLPAVSSLADSGPGSLRQAILDAQPGTSLVLNNTGTITLTSGEIAINKNLTIVGPGAAALAISGNNSSRVFKVAIGYTVNISGLTIRDGRGTNGVNGAAGQPGGGIYNGGTLTLNDCVVTNNRAGNGGTGGTSATGGAGGDGGGIYNYLTGILTLNQCVLSGNFGGTGGTGGSTPGAGRTDCDGNHGANGTTGGSGGTGGGIYSQGVLSMNRCTLSGCWSGMGGNGGTGGTGGNAYYNCITCRNAYGGNGGDGGTGGSAGNGGGIYGSGQTTLTGCTFSGNYAQVGGSGGAGGGGGDYGCNGPPGNAGSSGGSGSSGNGGGICNAGNLSLFSCTIADNTQGGGILNQPSAGPAHVGNTIVGMNSGYDVSGAFDSLGQNLIQATAGSTGFGADDLVGRNPMLGALADNGGPTPTRALRSGSPAIDAGAVSACLVTDQRGVIRPQDGNGDGASRCDIGAYEVTLPTILVATNQVIQATSSSGGVAVFSVTATNLGQPSVPVTCSPASGSIFQLGTNTVRCVAVDSWGVTNTQTFTVSVVDAAPPILTCPTNLMVTAAAGQCGASVTLSVTATDNVDPSPVVTCVPSSGSSFPVGRTTVHCTAVDASGNTNTCAFAVSVYPTQLFTAGEIWTPRMTDINREWRCVASSADGTRLAAAVYAGQIYTSTDAGITWIPRQDGMTFSVASSADGTKLVAGEMGGLSRLLTSTDAGLTWTTRMSGLAFGSVASSADGNTLVAVVNGGKIDTSTDSGTNWTPRESIQNWAAVASSADGTKLVALVRFGQIYTSAEAPVPLTDPPTILGATSQVVEATGPGGAVVTLNVTATNVCQPSVPVTCTPPSGSLFPFGTNTVTCVAVDAFGVTNTASFTVTVRDTTPPVLALLGANSLVHELGLPFVDPGATATDLCAGNLTASIVTNITVSIGIPGSYTNTYTVTDPSGNTVQTNRTVVVFAPLVFAGSSVPAPGQFRLQAIGTPGLSYTLQTSTNLIDWVDDTSVVAGPGGLIEYLEDMEPTAPACFYRLRWP
jgi:hypothetical protein